MATRIAPSPTSRKASASPAKIAPNGSGSNGAPPSPEALQQLLRALKSARDGDFSVRLPERKGALMGEIAAAFNDVAEMNARMMKELSRVGRVIGREGRMTERVSLPAATGAWSVGRDAINALIDDLVRPTTEVARVIEAVAEGDLSQKMALKIEGQSVKGEFLRIGAAVNSMVDQLSSFADEVTRVAREVGTEGKLGGQAKVKGVSGTWKDLTDNVNYMAANLTGQVRDIVQVTTAVAKGDLSQKITVEAKGEVAALAETINSMTDTLRAFADEVTRVAREVGTEGKLGGQAQVAGVAGTWKDLTDNVNYMAANLTGQVRDIVQVTTAVAKGDLSQKITVDVKGEILELKNTINTMVDQLSSFADEVTRVAREVGTDGKLGGQAQVKGVAGTWKDLTDNVNQLAATLTTQLRAIAEVSTAVTQGDLTRSIAVETQGEVAELKDNINQMIANLKETTQRNEEQDWLKTNLAKISGMMQGQRDLQTVSRMIMSELTPTVSAQHGAFFLTESPESDKPTLRLIATYGYKARKNVSNTFEFGEALVGQAAVEKTAILITEAPEDYIRVTSGLGEAAPVNIIVLPIVFEDQVLGVIELGAFRPFSEINQTFLEQLMETIGVVLNTIIANMRTEELLEQSQRLTRELQSQSVELQSQQEELQQTNAELQEKAALLADQNRNIEIKNAEIEVARLSLEERAEQLALSSKYKSEFLANMSHELRTPLNSLLILSKLLADNPETNLTDKQVEFAQTIYTAGSDLLTLINDILDLSKVEAGKMELNVSDVSLAAVRSYVQQTFAPVAGDKGLAFAIEVGEGLPTTIRTDEQRLQQILRNLLSNAVKFTQSGSVTLNIASPDPTIRYVNDTLRRADQIVAFSVVDTGIGVAEDKLKLIFEAFQQADGTTSRRYGGTGLGLSISREIAALLGGEIHAASTIDEGSTFTLYLPISHPGNTQVHDATLSAVGVIQTEAPAGPEASLIAVGGAALPGRAHDLDDDRDHLQPGDRMLLVVESEVEVTRSVIDAGRAAGFKVLAVTGAASAQALAQVLAQELTPEAVIIDADLGSTDGMAFLLSLKRNLATRHIPVSVLSADQRQSALSAGALHHVDKPITRRALDEALGAVSSFLDRPTRQLLVVEDDTSERNAIRELLGTGGEVAITEASSSEEAIAALEQTQFDCMVLDLKLPKASCVAVLDAVKSDSRLARLPVVGYAAKELTHREEAKLRKYAETVVLKSVGSHERLLDEATLFLHRSAATLPEDHRRILDDLHHADVMFAGKRVLVVDDDVRNVFALTSALEGHGMEVVFAENGRDGLEMLNKHPDVDLVLMDIMMPEMDGYQTTRAIRSMPGFRRLPVIALTAKAMKEDRDKSIAAGASDYIAKPVAIDQLLSLMRVWLHR